MTLDTAKTWSEILTKWIGAIALILGGSFTLTEYYSHKGEVKTRATLEFLSRFNNNSNQEAWTRLREAQQETHGEVVQLLTRKDVSTEAIAREYSEYIMRIVSEYNLTRSLDGMTILFEEIANCVSLDICDQDSAVSFFQRKGSEFFRAWYPYFCSEREKWNDPSIGGTLEYFYNPPRHSSGSVCDASVEKQTNEL